MRRVTAAGPAVVGEHLYGVRNGPLLVGSPAWATWLATAGPDHHAFTFPAAAGGLHRALREWRREQPYWYVKVRIGSTITSRRSPIKIEKNRRAGAGAISE